MASIPAPIRVTLGLIATALDTVQDLVEHAPELPMEAVGNSMQLSLRLQQHYVALLTRGDEFLANLRGAPDEAPAWATFDETPTPGASESTGADDVPWSDEPATEDLPPAHREGQPRHAGQGDPLFDAVVTATPPTPPATKGARKAPSAARPAAKTATAKTAGPAANAAPPVETAAEQTRPAKKAAKKAPAAASAPAKKAGKKAAKKAVTAKKAASDKASSATTSALENSAPAKRAPRRARTVPAAPPIVSPPPLDAELDNGAASARPVSAFDLVADAPGLTSAPAAASADGDPASDAF